MKGLVEFITEKLRDAKNGTIIFDVKKGKVIVDDLIQGLSNAHNNLPTKDVIFACDDYEDYDEQTYFEYDGIEGEELRLKFKDRMSFVNKNLYDKLIKDLDEYDKKDITIYWDGMNNDDMQNIVIGFDDKKDAILIQLGK